MKMQNKIIFKYYYRTKAAKFENKCKNFLKRKKIKQLFE